MIKKLRFVARRGWFGKHHCAAQLFAPKRGAGNGGGIVMAHGLGGTMDSGLFPMAEKFAAAGFHVLVFDYRNFGLSDGRPRQYISVPCQLADWKAAIFYLRGHAEVDAHRVGLWGISFSGGHVLHLAQQDKNIMAVVAQVPHIDAYLSATLATYKRGEKMNAQLVQQIKAAFWRRFIFGRKPMLQLIAENKKQAALLAAPEAIKYRSLAGESWRNAVDARSFLSGKLARNNPAVFAQDIDQPTLIQMGLADETISNEAISNFARRAGPIVQLARYECGHFGLLTKPHFSKAAQQAATFFAAHLLA